MELSKLGRKGYQILLPIYLIIEILVRLEFSTQIIILSTTIFSIVYILIWHELRIRNLEKKEGVEK